MVALIFYLIILGLFLVRLLNWLAIFQQKEYRTDRLILYLKTREGFRNFLSVLPMPSALTKTGLKRPVRTLRIYFFGIVSFFIALLLGFLNIALFSPLNFFEFFGIWLAIIFMIPLTLYIINLPFNILKIFIIYFELIRAKKKIHKSKNVIIGITGSYGKTSTKLLLQSALSQEFSVFATPKSHNTLYSVAKSINQDYQSQQILILEYGAYTKGEIKKMAKWFKPDIAVITGLTPQHLGLFGSLENIVKAKSELVRALQKNGLVFYNGSDAGTIRICEAGGAEKKIDYSRINISDIGMNNQGKLHFFWAGKKVQTNLIGEHYLDTIRAAISIGRYLELDDKSISQGIQNFVNNDSFITSHDSQNESLIIDDGRSTNPKGFQAGIDIIEKILQRNKYDETILITAGIVDLGKMSDEVHLKLAKKSSMVFTTVLFYGMDGREHFKKYFGDDLIYEKVDIVKFLAQKNKKRLVLIEGKIPKWIYQLLGVKNNKL